MNCAGVVDAVVVAANIRPTRARDDEIAVGGLNGHAVVYGYANNTAQSWSHIRVARDIDCARAARSHIARNNNATRGRGCEINPNR